MANSKLEPEPKFSDDYIPEQVERGRMRRHRGEGRSQTYGLKQYLVLRVIDKGAARR
jgi:hypothetical protein